MMGKYWDLKSFVVGAIVAIIVGAFVRSLFAYDDPYTLDDFISGIRAYMAEPDPPPEHPTRPQHMHERTSQLWTILLQLDADIAANSHPITIQATATQVAACAAVIGIRYEQTWKPER